MKLALNNNTLLRLGKKLYSDLNISDGMRIKDLNITTEKSNKLIFRNTVLFINFNRPHYEVLDRFNSLYSQYFPNIVYYGDSAVNQRNSPVTVTTTTDGSYAYIGMADFLKKVRSGEYKAHDENGRPVEITGVLYTNDDVLLNPLLLSFLPLDELWLVEPHVSTNRSQPIGWIFERDARTTEDSLQKAAREIPLIRDFYNNMTILYGTYSDFYYMPNNKEAVDLFVQIAESFYPTKMFNEQAIELIFKAIVKFYPVKRYNVGIVFKWEPYRYILYDLPIKYFRGWKFFGGHPIKIGYDKDVYDDLVAYFNMLNWISSLLH
jgi:hypothetical protein